MSDSPHKRARVAFACVVVAAALCLGLAAADSAAAAPPAASALDASSQAIVPGQPLTLPYPRLAMWNPDPSRQPLSELARYDYVVLCQDNFGFAPQLKALSPDIMLLPYTNACELHYKLDAAASSHENDALRQIPTEWLLTQVGASLTQDATATDSTLHVSRVNVMSGGKVQQLFVAGDLVVIGDELVYVQSVDAGTCTLSVRRGCIKPAAPHAANARVAATITVNPHCVVLNLSTLCPKATVDAAVGPETWGQYNARITSSLLEDPVWDGVYIDRSDPDPSSLLGPDSAHYLGGALARTIDPDRSNTIVTDYSGFDSAWDAGIRSYESQLRAAVGDSRLIIVNTGMPNYDLLNGNNFEGFPGAGWRLTTWSQMVFGPRPGGSYSDWMASAQQPNLSTILTYDDASASSPAFVPNYQKMRYGLCTALLNDGFFSYEASWAGQYWAPLWFDEYDNAGQGCGYLGQPLGPARRAIAGLATPNLAPGGDFDTTADIGKWYVYPHDGYAATLALDGAEKVVGAGSVRADITSAAGTPWALPILLRQSVAVTQGTDYTLSFWAKADRDHVVDAWVEQRGAPWKRWLDFGTMALTTSWQRFQVSYTSTGSDADAVMGIGLGQASGAVWLDDVSLQSGGDDVWRRDFDGGISLVNASNATVTVPLGGVFRKIKGSQDPSVNDGSLVTQVAVSAHDGIVLLRPASADAVAAQAVGQLVTEWQHCTSRSAKAREYYARVAKRTKGSAHLRAARAAAAWDLAFRSVRTTRGLASAWQAALGLVDHETSQGACASAYPSARRATALVSRAWHLGRASGSGATTAQRSAVSGWKKTLTARAAEAALT